MLPSYSKQHPQDAEQAEPFLASTDVDVRTSSETAPPLYPPTSTPGTDGRHNVEYSYAPVYPRKGKIENVVGVLGNTKRVSLSGSKKRPDRDDRSAYIKSCEAFRRRTAH